MGNIDCENGVLHIEGYSVPFKSLVELLDMIRDLKDTEIVDVDISGEDVICTFADGEVQKAHCHPEDYENWSLETGISICLGKYLTGGSNAYNRLVHQGVKIFNTKIRKKAEEIADRLEAERVRANKRRKHERYLKRRDERRKAEMCSECEDRHDCEDRKDVPNDRGNVTEESIFKFIKKLADDLGLSVDIEVVR